MAPAHVRHSIHQLVVLTSTLAAVVGCGAVSEQEKAPLGELAQELATPRFEKGVSQGRDHACAISDSGALYCWGNNKFGQMGDGVKILDGTVYRPSSDMICEAGTSQAAECHISPKPVLGMGSGVSHVAAATYHTCAIQKGQVYCWGWNKQGLLGSSAELCGWSPTPTPVSLPEGAVDLAAGAYHTCALTKGGSVYCWGLAGEIGVQSQVGVFCGSVHGNYTPVQVAFPDVPLAARGVTKLYSAGSRTVTCALHTDGGVSCWGAAYETVDTDNLGDLFPQAVVRGHGTDFPRRLTGASSVAGTEQTACAHFMSSGTVECWGHQGNDGCGRGRYSCVAEPRLVLEKTASGNVTLGGAVQLVAGEGAWCVMRADDTPRCWGANDACVVGSGLSQLGEAQPLSNANGTPVINGYTMVIGGQTSCIRRRSGELFCLGADKQAEHGDSAPSDKHCSQQRGAGTLRMATIP